MRWAGSGLLWGGTPRGVAGRLCPDEKPVCFCGGKNKSVMGGVESGKSPCMNTRSGCGLGQDSEVGLTQGCSLWVLGQH
jgi:hypothetical protein